MGENQKSATMTQQRKNMILEQLWLSYYNDTLYEKGMITELERNKMRSMINARVSS